MGLPGFPGSGANAQDATVGFWVQNKSSHVSGNDAEPFAAPVLCDEAAQAASVCQPGKAEAAGRRRCSIAPAWARSSSSPISNAYRNCGPIHRASDVASLLRANIDPSKTHQLSRI